MEKHEYLLAFDFDGTAGDTFTPSPNQIGVHEAYQWALEAVFGPEAVSVYQDLGGLQNRAPAELVCAMVDWEGSFIQKARATFERERLALTKFAPHIPLVWEEESPANSISEMLVRFKLMHLLNEIGPLWPKPCEGFLDFLDAVESLTAKGISLKLAILSSGHQVFINKTFDAWGKPAPVICVTDDEVRWRKYPADVCHRVKPSTFPFSLLHHQWLKQQNGQFSPLPLPEAAKSTRPRMIYFGDDPIKDGMLARNVGIPFGWFNPTGKVVSTTFPRGSFSFTDWRQIKSFLQQSPFQKLLLEGKSCSEIFSQFPC